MACILAKLQTLPDLFEDRTVRLLPDPLFPRIPPIEGTRRLFAKLDELTPKHCHQTMTSSSGGFSHKFAESRKPCYLSCICLPSVLLRHWVYCSPQKYLPMFSHHQDKEFRLHRRHGLVHRRCWGREMDMSRHSQWFWDMMVFGRWQDPSCQTSFCILQASIIIHIVFSGKETTGFPNETVLW